MTAPETAAFRFRHPVRVRFSDVDGMGHVHHARALVYFEEARWAYWARVVGPPAIDRIEYVMAEATVRWKRRILWPQEVAVGVRVSRVGRKHFEMEFRIEAEDGALLVAGRSVQVAYDAATESSVPMSETLLARFEAFEGSLERG